MTDAKLDPRERLTLGALRYAVNDEAASYLAIMRLFTTGTAGFLSDQSADEITERLAANGIDLDRDTVDVRLSYLVDHGNLARSPRETEARSVRDYLTNRARYQLTPRGELVQRQVDELLQHSDTAREVSSEMLPGILHGIETLRRRCENGLAEADPGDLATRIATLFAQFEVLVTSTRQFYSYLTTVLNRFDLGRDEFVAFKNALFDYLARFVDEVARHMPQVADELVALEPYVTELCARAGAGERLVSADGSLARRSTGLEPEDWTSLHTWFVGSDGRRSDAENVRLLATEAMRSLMSNLRRISAGADREQSRYTDLTRLARWFADSSDEEAHALWAATFGLYSARHLGYAVEPEGDPLPGTTSWWRAPAAEVPVGLRTRGERKISGRASARVDYSRAKAARLAQRAEQEKRLRIAVAELANVTASGSDGAIDDVTVSDLARRTLLDAYTLAAGALPRSADGRARGVLRVGGGTVRVDIERAPGHDIRIAGPSGVLTLRDLTVHVAVELPVDQP